jgi:hypothetical protein
MLNIVRSQAVHVAVRSSCHPSEHVPSGENVGPFYFGGHAFEPFGGMPVLSDACGASLCFLETAVST